eukprot:2388283-Rhodomonas_salina.1
MSGTGTAYAGLCLRSCYAMPGTDIAYAATRSRGNGAIMPSTESGYAATKSAVLSKAMLLPGSRVSFRTSPACPTA